MFWRNVSATHVVAATLGVFGGLLSLEHGYFELLQGNAAPGGILISAIGPPCELSRAWHACEPALTLVPSLAITGVLAILVGLFVVLVAALGLRAKHGPRLLIVLALLQLLVGGGIIPVFWELVAAGVAPRSAAPPDWWRARLAIAWQRSFARLWPWALVAFVAWGLLQWVVGTLFNDCMLHLAGPALLVTLGLLLLAIATGFARDALSAENAGRQPLA